MHIHLRVSPKDINFKKRYIYIITVIYKCSYFAVHLYSYSLTKTLIEVLESDIMYAGIRYRYMYSYMYMFNKSCI